MMMNKLSLLLTLSAVGIMLTSLVCSFPNIAIATTTPSLTPHAPIYIESNTNFTTENNKITSCNIYNNTEYGVYNCSTLPQYEVNATNNWWGSASGPGGKGPGSGDKHVEKVNYIGITFDRITFDPSKIKIPLDSEKTVSVILGCAPNGLSGYNITILLSSFTILLSNVITNVTIPNVTKPNVTIIPNVTKPNVTIIPNVTKPNVTIIPNVTKPNVTIIPNVTLPNVAEITSVDFPSWASINSNSPLPSDSVWIKAMDLNKEVESGARNVTLASLTIRGNRLGSCNILLTNTRMDDDSGNHINVYTIPGQVEVVGGVIPFPGYANPPTDPDNDGLYEDINGNRRKDFEDVVCLFKNLGWAEENQPCECFDFNENGRIDFEDIVKLFEEI